MANNDPRRHTRLLLLSQFKSRVSPRSSRFQWPSDRSLLEAQSFVLADLFQDQSQSQSQSQASSHSTASVAYQKIFLKELINRIDRAIASLSDEQDEWETDADLLQHYTDLMINGESTHTGQGPPNAETVQYIFPRHVGASPSNPFASTDSGLLENWHTIDLIESSSLVQAGTTAVKTWEASLRLASHLLYLLANGDQAVVQPGTRVLELGSGTGLLTCLVALLQRDRTYRGSDSPSSSISPPCVFSTDLDTVVNGKSRETVELNGLGSAPTLTLQPLDWLDIHDGATSPLDTISPTLILGADIIFDPDIIPALVSTIKAALYCGHHSNSTALIASTIRNAATYQTFLDEVKRVGLQSEKFELQRYALDDEGNAGDPLILPFNSDHEDSKGGVVKGLRIWKA